MCACQIRLDERPDLSRGLTQRRNALAHLAAMRKPEPESAPVSIPLVVLNVHEDGTVAVTVNGSPLDPDPPAVPWRRSSFGRIIDRATHERTTPARVEVREVSTTRENWLFTVECGS